ncbi:DNA-binding transcriptional MerR regulator [Microbacterium sp. SORGH_AS428]|uniref:MerR family transcriptional regulator n=1 Tax=Microbacterium sp. SORGH_AS_0428 TaxID=3041788 RepID=UPI00285CED73|nr:MerR family transcriptional regulator [Microbacterium sp. SORGH_AS_0428]MDR6201263.1 DNA-binding transcriptional MerR regulator [Microbacterium sp. SORGH_AS_0428]
MRSGELARLAGVTVRALRHYHQEGVLPEPERGSNGYREYRVSDLVRVLRIRRLSAVGVPLDEMTALLDGETADAGALLDSLDAELAAQIDRLAAQRSLIARLRATDAAPDVPPELAPHLAVLAAAGGPADLANMDRDQSVLLAHLAGEEGMPRLTRLYEILSTPALSPLIAEISARFAEIDTDTASAEIDGFIETVVTAFGPIVAEVTDAGGAVDLGPGAGLIDDLVRIQFTPAQRRVLREIERRLS